MSLSRERLRREATATGFRVEILEKVAQLLTLLDGFERHPYLKGRLALKGGTALNLFVFDVPRLSIDMRIGTPNAQIPPGAQYLEPRDEGRESTRVLGGRCGVGGG
ncbi:MAG TPA: nucleotidyl transferase AbiEii/AbiGii toxin family protein [Myxococcota bacterium]